MKSFEGDDILISVGDPQAYQKMGLKAKAK